MPRVSGSGTRRSDMKRMKERRTATLERNRRLLKIAGLVLAVLLVFGGPIWIWQSGWIGRQQARLIDYTAQNGLGLREIFVAGRIQTDAKDVMTALGIKVGDPLVTFDMEAARTRLEALPWVKSATIQRRYPDTIFVTLVEREPFAFWQREKKLSLIDETGFVLTTENLGRFAGKPQLIGEEAPKRAAELFRDLAMYPELQSRVRTATLVGERRWNLRLENGVDVRLPENDIPSALARLSAAQAEAKILDRDVVVVDLRLSDRLIVQTTAEAAARRVAPKEGI